MPIERFPMWKTTFSLASLYFNPKYKQNSFFFFVLRYAIESVCSADTKFSLKHFYVVYYLIFKTKTTNLKSKKKKITQYLPTS